MKLKKALINGKSYGLLRTTDLKKLAIAKK